MTIIHDLFHHNSHNSDDKTTTVRTETVKANNNISAPQVDEQAIYATQSGETDLARKESSLPRNDSGLVDNFGQEKFVAENDSEIVAQDKIDFDESQQVRVQEAPAEINTHIHHHEQKEIVPEVHRTREQEIIQPVIQPVHEQHVEETQEVSEAMAPEKREIRHETSMDNKQALEAHRSGFQSSSTTDSTQHETRVNAPIIHEHVHTKIVEEIQPVIDRDIHVPVHRTITQPIHEHVVDGTQILDTKVLPTENKPATGASLGGIVGGMVSNLFGSSTTTTADNASTTAIAPASAHETRSTTVVEPAVAATAEGVTSPAAVSDVRGTRGL